MARILIVDDAMFMRMFLKNILTEAGHEIVGEAENGLVGFNQFKKLKPDLVTMDITMPTMNGLEATGEIIKYDKNAKIVMCSAMGNHVMVAKSIAAGARNFLVKPFSHDDVITIIKNELN